MALRLVIGKKSEMDKPGPSLSSSEDRGKKENMEKPVMMALYASVIYLYSLFVDRLNFNTDIHLYKHVKLSHKIRDVCVWCSMQ